MQNPVISYQKAILLILASAPESDSILYGRRKVYLCFITEYFGENLLPAHQERCQSWKTKQKESTSESPWLSARPKGCERLAITGGSENMLRCNPENNSTRQQLDVSEKKLDNGVRSPPWLLAAERRLQQQRHSAHSDRGVEQNNVDHSSTPSVSSHTNREVNFDRETFLEAQANQLEKYKFVTNNTTCYKSLNPNITAARFSNRLSNIGADFEIMNRSTDTTAGQSKSNSNGGVSNNLHCFIVSDDDDDNGDDDCISASEVDDENSVSSSNNFNKRNIQVECPLCGDYFPDLIIEMHASTCYL